MPDPQTTHTPTTLSALARSVEPLESWVVSSNGPLHDAMRQFVAAPPDAISMNYSGTATGPINEALAYLPFGVAISLLQELNDRSPEDVSAFIAAASERNDPISRVLVQRIAMLDRAELIDQVFGVEHLQSVADALATMESETNMETER